jgi:hypothetical protein
MSELSYMDPVKMQQLLAELSAEEQEIFAQILANLSAVNGDISQLSSSDQEQLGKLVKKHHDQEPQQPESHSDSTPTATETPVPDELDTVAPEAPDESPTQSDFGQYVVDHIKVLCEGGSSLSDAVRYAYHNKYLPVTLRDEQVCKEVLQRYQGDILQLAHSFRQLESAHLADAKLLVGFAWFAVVYECYQYIEAYGDLH